LCHFVPNPKILHFHRPQLLSYDGIVCDSNCGCIIATHWYFGLGVAEVFEGELKNHPFLAFQKKGAEFGFHR
jgi:hypothetical protein